MESDDEPDVFHLTKMRRDQVRQEREVLHSLLFDNLVVAVLNIPRDTCLSEHGSQLKNYYDAYMTTFYCYHGNQSPLSESELNALAMQAYQTISERTFSTHHARKILAIKTYLHEQIMGWGPALIPSVSANTLPPLTSQNSFFDNVAVERRQLRPRSKVFVSLEDAEEQGFKLPNIIG